MDEELYKKEQMYQASLGLVRLKRAHTPQSDTIQKSRKTVYQVMFLAEVFKLTGYPSTQTKMDISLLINLPFSTIQIWFQNERRAKRRANKRVSPYGINNDNELFEINIITLMKINEKVKRIVYNK